MQARAGAGGTLHHFLSPNSPKAEMFASPFIQSILHSSVLSICCLSVSHNSQRLMWLLGGSVFTAPKGASQLEASRFY